MRLYSVLYALFFCEKSDRIQPPNHQTTHPTYQKSSFSGLILAQLVHTCFLFLSYRSSDVLKCWAESPNQNLSLEPVNYLQSSQRWWKATNIKSLEMKLPRKTHLCQKFYIVLYTQLQLKQRIKCNIRYLEICILESVSIWRWYIGNTDLQALLFSYISKNSPAICLDYWFMISCS